MKLLKSGNVNRFCSAKIFHFYFNYLLLHRIHPNRVSVTVLYYLRWFSVLQGESAGNYRWAHRKLTVELLFKLFHHLFNTKNYAVVVGRKWKLPKISAVELGFAGYSRSHCCKTRVKYQPVVKLNTMWFESKTRNVLNRMEGLRILLSSPSLCCFNHNTSITWSNVQHHHLFLWIFRQNFHDVPQLVIRSRNEREGKFSQCRWNKRKADYRDPNSNGGWSSD